MELAAAALAALIADPIPVKSRTVAVTASGVTKTKDAICGSLLVASRGMVLVERAFRLKLCGCSLCRENGCGCNGFTGLLFDWSRTRVLSERQRLSATCHSSWASTSTQTAFLPLQHREIGERDDVLGGLAQRGFHLGQLAAEDAAAVPSSMTSSPNRRKIATSSPSIGASRLPAVMARTARQKTSAATTFDPYLGGDRGLASFGCNTALNASLLLLGIDQPPALPPL
ncbi:hypothetical protein MSIMFI_00435 [Mycobacterium simulans]|nr:hypothetical protein MSIMFI_00435 [Mycobacterium simulans]